MNPPVWQPWLRPGRRGYFPWFCWLIVLLWLPVLASCGWPRPAQERSRVWSRLIDDSAVQEFDKVLILDHESVVEWKLNTLEDFSEWELTDLDDPISSAQSVAVRVLGPRPELTRNANFDAGGVDAFDMSVSGLRKGSLEIYWAGPGEGFSSRRKLTQTVVRATGNQSETYRFDLTSHPDWSGDISRVRLILPATQGRLLRFNEIHWLRSSVNEARLSTALKTSWKIELDSDSRLALLCPPGTGIDRVLDVPADALLSFSYGLDAAVHRPVTFTVSVSRSSGSRTVVFSEDRKSVV